MYKYLSVPNVKYCNKHLDDKPTLLPKACFREGLYTSVGWGIVLDGYLFKI